MKKNLQHIVDDWFLLGSLVRDFGLSLVHGYFDPG
jgi:hypothetical protein